MTQITMPKLSDSMIEGTILSWLIEDGQLVALGDELVEIETDKATVTYEAEGEGTLRIVSPVGTSVAVGEVIAQLDEVPAGSLVQEAGETPAIPEPVRPTAVRSGAQSAPASVAAVEASAPDLVVRATPLARRAAHAHGVVLEGIEGTGPRRRIVRADVFRVAGLMLPDPVVPEPAGPPAEAAGAAPVAETAPSANGLTASGAAAPNAVADPTRRELTRLQRVVAKRMAEANSTVPHFQVQTEVTLDSVIALRAQLKQSAGAETVVPSINDLVVKASALALRRHPLANGSFRDDGLQLHERVNVGVAVAAEGALVVPVIRDADVKSVGQIARETRALAARVRDGSSTPEDLDGGTFTVSNLGMFGMTAIWPVVNLPQAAILGVGAAREVLRRRDGEIVDATMLTLTLSCDHRILYGADAARFLADIGQMLERPLELAL
ncbi:dihydrolipoamide acetyltransferase family protein [Conexibacter stalactiti]|uniref:Dihydrolipoamide acetyltransferase component of pyruvate dehydrogenase complex n=1 Tax=Conexibacter stalactiti TaxID=1940611 RepID=A0ABU4HIA8_9ACTN|nr:dihydrolipoamide acetyltransferase family protein [Conexibacter stalactiti]MDW5593050.1 dihydrolipoamide acetyltransferase family protein [Conexibacter stalactiti]MEC5033691.1 dihydrolipoamide acetyltransferase family protein [Conexibacter stalactiti]